MSEPSRMERYDLVNRQWLPTISLSVTNDALTAGWVDADGIYAAYGMSAYRYDLDGNNEMHLADSTQSISQILGDGNLLFLNRSASLYARFTSIDKGSNSVVSTFQNYIDALGGASIAPSLNKMFGRSLGVSPSDITYVNYNDDGTFGSGGDSSYHGDYPGATKTWVFPDDAKVVDSSGTVYSTTGLTYLKSFGSSITDLAFYGDEVPILLYGSTLTAYTVTILPTGSTTLDHSPSRIFVEGDDVLTFTADAAESTGLYVRSVALSELDAPTPGEPIDPTDLPYTPDSSFVDKDGILHLFSKANQSLFRWDCWAGQYTNTIPLIGVPDYAAYSAENHTVYLAYSSGLIRAIDLHDESYSEVPFANLPGKPYGLSTAGPYLFGIDASGSWDTHYTYAPDGSLVDSVDWNYYSKEYIWSDANQKMYFFRDDTSPNDLLWEQINADGTTYPSEPAGGIGSKKDSPLHTSTGFSHPIRVAPDGSIVVLGSGMIHDGTTLARQTVALTNSLSDIAWAAGDIFTVRTVDSSARFQKWSYPDCVAEFEKSVEGTAHRLLALEHDALIGVTINASGIPEFHLMNSGLGDFDPMLVYPYDPVLVEGYEGYPLMPSNVVFTLCNVGPSNLPWKVFSPAMDVSAENGLLTFGETAAVHVAANREGSNLSVGSHTLPLFFLNQNTSRSQIRLVNANVFPVPPAPDAPTLALPLAATNGIAIASQLEWAHTNGGDDEGPWDTASRFGVYLGTDPANLTLVASGLTTNVFDPGLLDVDTTYYWQIVASNVVGTTASPIQRFTTWTSGPFDHFAWSSIATNQRISVPFGVSLSAVDAYGYAVADFSGVVALEGYENLGMGAGSLLDEEVHVNTASSTVASRGLRFTVSDDMTVTHLSHYWGTKVSLWTDAGELLSSVAVTNAAGSWSHTELPEPVLLEAGETYRISSHGTGVVYRRSGGVPFSFANGTVISSCYGSDFPSSTYTSYIDMVDFRYAVGRPDPISLSPNKIADFVDGVWTGEVVAGEQVGEVFLRATTSDGIYSDSGVFTVDYLGSLSLELPADLDEAGGVLAGRGVLSVSSEPSADLIVDLSVDGGGELSVPAQVTIPAGQTRVVFDVAAIDDLLLDGTVVSLVRAVSFGYRDATAEVRVNDSESATMVLSLPQTTFEGAGSIRGALQLDRAPDCDVAVELVSNNEGKIGSIGVVVPAGKTFVAFSLPVLDNDAIDGIQTATIEAVVRNWPTATTSVFVFDNETNGIELQLPSSSWEGDTLTNSGMVTLSGTAPADVNVLLTCSDATEMSVPDYLTIPAGQISVSFEIEFVDDDETDGTQSVSILAEAPGYVPSIGYVDVLDNELYGFGVSMSQDEVDVLVPISVGIAAKNIDGLTLQAVDGPLYLSASGARGDVPVDPSTISNQSVSVVFGKVDDNVVLVVEDGMGHSGTGTPVNVMGAVVALTPAALTNTVVNVDETYTRTMIISNAGNAELQFNIDVPFAAPTTNDVVDPSNLIVNGDFEQGNTGFVSEYTEIPLVGTVTRGVYTVGANSLAWDSTLPAAMTNHTSGGTQMMMANGSATADTVVWQQEVGVVAGEVYDWSAMVAGLDDTIPATLEFRIDGTSVGSVAAAYLTWQEFSAEWTATASETVVLGIVDTMVMPVPFITDGNVFAIDDVSFQVQEAETPPTDEGLVAYYPFDGDAADATGNGHDGTVSGATLTSDREGVFDSAYEFDGVDDYIEMDNSLGTEATPFTVAAWMCSTNTGYQMVVSKKPSGEWNNGQWQLVASSYTGFWYADQYGNSNVTKVDADVDLHDGKWHHLCGMIDADGARLYIDGELAAEDTSVNLVSHDDAAIHVGDRAYSSGRQYFDGKVDDVRIYNRALSTAEVGELFSEGDDGLVAYYPFNGNANDASGNGHDGTVNGALLSTDRDGAADGAFSFDGIDDRIDIPDEAAFDFERSNSFSIVFWMKSADGDISGNNMVAKKESSGGHRGYNVALRDGLLRAQLVDDYLAGNWINQNGTTVLSDGVWHHVGVTYDGSSKAAGLKFYVDGASEAVTVEADNLSGTILTDVAPTIGSRSSVYPYEGDLDAVRIYNRALSADEMKVLYEAADDAEVDPESNADGWLAVDPVSGTVAPGSNVTVSVTFDAAGFADGAITNEMLTVTCNDALSATNEVPVSMQVVVPFDLDGDGLPNWWELKFFADLAQCDATLDADGDGVCNRDEFIAGMDPTNAASVFMLNAAEALPDNGFVLHWDAVTGRVYSVWWKPTLTNEYRLLESEIRHPRGSYTDRVHNAENCGFYTIDVELD
ncbi:LamG domain-containing protein [Pontiella sp.]|uniref:LamG domain-containing protein n=1 Tax=Pontiella sp. TaxID=2837462 RepID=UPI0035652625